MAKVKIPKPCSVCEILKQDEGFSYYINTMLKKGEKISVVSNAFVEQNYIAPTEHYIKIHKVKCLKDFIISESQNILESKENKKPQNCENDVSEVNTLNIIEELEKYNSMNLEQKTKDKISSLEEIEFLSIKIIKHQLTYGRISTKAIVPKEDVSALKQIADIINIMSDTESKKPKSFVPPIINLSFLDKYGIVYKTDNGETSCVPDTRKVDPRDAENYLEQFDTKDLEDYLRSVDTENLENFIRKNNLKKTKNIE